MSKFSKYSSKVRRVNIELPNYKYFHSPSLIEQNDPRFIGRTQIIERLKNILTNNKPKSGAYLITGYRGMGKSSFVNKVLNQITLRSNKAFSKLIWYVLLFFIIYYSSLLLKLDSNLILLIPLIVVFIVFVSNVIFFNDRLFHLHLGKVFLKISFHFIKDNKNYRKNINRIIKRINLKYYFLNSISIGREWINKRRRVILKLNLGHEILNEKDILSLIARSVEKEFKNFSYSFRRQFVFYLLKYSLILLVANQIVKTEPIPQFFLSEVLPTQNECFKSETNCYFDEVLKNKKDSTLDEAIKSKEDSICRLQIKTCYSELISRKLNSSDTMKYYQKAKVFIINGVNSVDIYCDWAYFFITSNFFYLFHIQRGWVPFHLNYLFLLIFFILNFLLTLLFREYLKSGFSRYTSRKVILRNLIFLNERIDSNIRLETDSSIKTSNGRASVAFDNKRSKEYPLANIRQIEKELIEIFDDISHLVLPILRPQFIIVFDELDKIDPYFNNNIKDKEDEFVDFDNTVNGFTGGTATRLRKQNVLKLLANLKFFITTAKSKFIFIAGRELYDAFLADVSDREFSISSIFHDVIYVDSFLSDSSDNNKADIISMAEHYVCQFIIPAWFVSYYTLFEAKNKYDALSLKVFEKYLSTRKGIKDDKEIKKTIMLLYQFVHYLTHVSNGAPKKITNLFERHLVTGNNTNNDDIFVGRNYKTIYLSFGYFDQCKIGFIHYLASPIMLSIVNNVHDYGDKMLVSASFLIDHIYKFHRNGFSWRNLEHAPEILDINRTPELRNFINIIISYLTQTHVSPVISGLYVFKFPKKISEEISFISKISEEASAIFNFSLDESLAVKRHYSKLLYQLTKQSQNEKMINLKDGEYVHSIADIHHILGDLHLADEEYTEAIFDYQSAIQYQSRNFRSNYESHQITHLLFLVRTMLKLGLAYEMRRTFNSAYITYSELVSMAIDFRYINENKFGLEYKIERVPGWIAQKAILFKKDGEQNYIDKDQKESSEYKFRKETLPSSLNNKEVGKDMIFCATGDELIETLSKITTPLKNKLISRLSLFEDIRLMYQAILAKLFVLEKHQLGGISLSNIKVSEGEFLNLHLTTNVKEKFLISADFFKKLGDILFYKNGLVTKADTTLFTGLYFWDYNVDDDIDAYGSDIETKHILKKLKVAPFKINSYNNLGVPFGTQFKKWLITQLDTDDFKKEYINNLKVDDDEYSITRLRFKKFIENPDSLKINGMEPSTLDKTLDCCNRRKNLLLERKITPCYACKYYNRSLKILADNLLNTSKNDSENSKSYIFLRELDNNQNFYSYRSNYSQLLASTLGGFGDILVSCSDSIDYIFPNFLNEFFSYMKDNKEDSFTSFEKDIHNEITSFNVDEKWIYPFKIDFDSIKLRGKSRFLENEKSTDQVIYEIRKNGLTHQEKALLYYLASAKYYKRSSNLKEAHIMYKKILHLLVQYTYSKPSLRFIIAENLENIKKEIIARIIQCIYAAYEHIHVVEIQKIKWILTTELYESLDLKLLSLFPEIEETIYSFYELKMLCDSPSWEGDIYNIYKHQALSPSRVNSSIYNRLISLRFKALLNRYIFQKIISDYKFDEHVYSPIHPVIFYKQLSLAVKDADNKQNIIDNFKIQKGENYSSVEYLLDFVEFLIIDSIFCLQKFIEVMYPHNKTTLFTNSYVADIYKQLFEWTQVFDFIFMLYAYYDDEYPLNNTSSTRSLKKDNIIEKLKNHCIKRSEIANIDNTEYVNSFFDDGKEVSNSKFKVQFKNFNHIFQNRAETFFDQLIGAIDKSNTHLVDCNYFAEMAIKKYQSAFSMHREGKAYKNMIDDMFYLNDDLDNDSFKFYLSIERYRINSGDLRDNQNKLKSVYGNSSLFEIDNYVKYLEEERL